MIKVSLDEVMGDDPNSSFWQNIFNSPNFKNFEQDIDHIITQSRKHGKPYNDIDPDLIDPYDWKLK